MLNKIKEFLTSERSVVENELKNNPEKYKFYSKPVRPWVADYNIFGLKHMILDKYWLQNKKFTGAVWIANCWHGDRKEYDTKFIDFQSDTNVRSPNYPLTNADKKFFLDVYQKCVFEIFE